MALSSVLRPPFAGSSPHTIRLRFGSDEHTLSIDPKAPMAQIVSTSGAPGELALVDGTGGGMVVVRAETSYVPAADGSQVAAQAQGFVVGREMLRLRKDQTEPPEHFALGDPGTTVTFTVGDVVEDHAQVVNPNERHYVAVTVPLAAGMEPLNPQLATAPADAKPTGTLTAEPTYAQYLDDRVAFYYDTLPKGTFDFYFRSRATTPGAFIQPAAQAEMMYDASVRGNSAGARVVIHK